MNKKRIISVLMAAIVTFTTIIQPFSVHAEDSEQDLKAQITAFIESGNGSITLIDSENTEYNVTHESAEPLDINVSANQTFTLKVENAPGYELSNFCIFSEDDTVIEDISDKALLNDNLIFEKEIFISEQDIKIKASFENVNDVVNSSKPEDSKNVSVEQKEAENISSQTQTLEQELIKEKIDNKYLAKDSKNTITILNSEYGKIQINTEEFSCGDTIELQSKPDAGYRTEIVIVEEDTESDTPILLDVTETEKDKFSFVMPDYSVRIVAFYIEQDYVFTNQIDENIKQKENILNSKLRAVAGETCTITPSSGNIYYGSWNTCTFNVSTSGGTFMGYCAEPMSPTPNGRYTVSELNSDYILSAILLYEIPELYEHLGKNIYNEKDNNMYAYCHAAIGYLYNGSLTGLSSSMAAGVKNMVNVIKAINDRHPNYEAHNDLLMKYKPSYKLYIAYNNAQDIVWVEKVLNGSLTLKKSSANTTLTNNNSCYSLEGATYGVYSNAACTTQVGTLTTNSSGTANTLSLKAGTYYVKETKAPKGYALDSTVRTVTISAGKTATVNTTDVPQSDPVTVLLGKVDKETNQNKPQGSASLANAQFTVKYYDVLMSTDPAKNGYTPKRTWVLKTDERGFTRLGDKYKVSGDEFYKLNGVVTLPLGTITIQETKAPEGYLINNEVFVRQITSNGVGEQVETYNQPTIPEQSLNLDVVKTLKGTSQAIPGVVFLHTKPDGSTEELTTDAYGKLSFKGLTYGVHTIEEKSVPDGYTKNPGKVTFTVATNNDIIVNSNTSAEKTGKMTFTIQSNGCALLQVEDILQPYSLVLHKINEKGKVLEGAEFTLYSDAGCTQAIETKATNSDGSLTFSGLIVGTKYYLKETKAPQGYRIPVDSNGKVAVYEIYTNSDPTNNVFEYFLNGTKHTEINGDYAITGTKADRIVNIKVVNYTGVKMPDTGTQSSLLLFAFGMGCMIAALFSKKRMK